MTRLGDIVSFVIVIAIAIGVDKGFDLDAVGFIACSALWFGIRAWSRAGEVNTAHKNSEEV